VLIAEHARVATRCTPLRCVLLCDRAVAHEPAADVLCPRRPGERYHQGVPGVLNLLLKFLFLRSLCYFAARIDLSLRRWVCNIFCASSLPAGCRVWVDTVPPDHGPVLAPPPATAADSPASPAGVQRDHWRPAAAAYCRQLRGEQPGHADVDAHVRAWSPRIGFVCSCAGTKIQINLRPVNRKVPCVWLRPLHLHAFHARQVRAALQHDGWWEAVSCFTQLLGLCANNNKTFTRRANAGMSKRAPSRLQVLGGRAAQFCHASLFPLRQLPVRLPQKSSGEAHFWRRVVALLLAVVFERQSVAEQPVLACKDENTVKQ
jgi:hypothetical protein